MDRLPPAPSAGRQAAFKRQDLSEIRAAAVIAEKQDLVGSALREGIPNNPARDEAYDLSLGLWVLAQPSGDP